MHRLRHLLIVALGLALLAPALASATPSPAVPFKKNLVVNPGAEDGEGSNNGSVVTIPGWKVIGNFTAVKYGISGFPMIKESTRIDGGDHFFAGGPEDHQSRAIQRIDIADHTDLIDRSKLKMVLRVQQAGWLSGQDTGQVVVAFLDKDGKILGEVRGRKVAGTDGKFVQIIRHRFIPPKTRSLRVLLHAVRGTGTYLDAYFDNIDVRIGRRGAAF